MIAHCKPATVEGVVLERANLDLMRQHEASRTLVKSPPELWAECSDAASLARHLGQFGEIRITRLEPETAVAWEGELASGTVRLEPSGWGTRVILTAEAAEEPEAAVEPVVEPEPEVAAVVEPEAVVEPVAVVDPVAAVEPVVEGEPEPLLVVEQPSTARPLSRRRGFFAWLKSWFEPPQPVATPLDPVAETAPVEEVDPEPVREPDPEPEPVREPEPDATREPEPEDPEPEAPEAQTSEPETPALDPTAALTAALDSLGQAHHRPFSRA
jgi:hypothetical protein